MTNDEIKTAAIEHGLLAFNAAFDRDDLDSRGIVAAIIEATCGSVWLDITFAPRDGTHFMACAHRPGFTFNERPPTVVHWHVDGFYTSVNELAPDHPFPATHFRPLPEPPKVTP
jgi:hypothetical protein